MPPVSVFAMTVSVVPLGIARSAISSFITSASRKARAGTALILRDRETIQSEVGRAEAIRMAARAFLARHRRHRRGLVVLISDFYDPAGPGEALDLLRYGRFEIVAIQVSAPEEARPALRGDVTVRDVETGEERDVTISPRALVAAERRHAALVRGLDGFCRERAIPCFTVTSDEAFDAVVLRVFRAGGLLR